MRTRSGAELLCDALTGAGASHVFGVPGTQTIQLFEALRRSSLRVVAGTHELSCGFMANGYYRASGKPGILTTIPGPGFAFTLAAIAEAAHDSAALVYVLPKARAISRKFELQRIDQDAMLRPVVKQVLNVDHASEVASATREAYYLSLSGEPGPVVLHLAPEALLDQSDRLPPSTPVVPDRGVPDLSVLRSIARLLCNSRYPMLFVGQGAADASALVQNLAERFQMPVVSTRSGRGAIPESHALSLVFDVSEPGLSPLNDLLDRSDLILVLGCKLTHNGTFGFRLRLSEQKLIHVDSSAETLGANYPGRYLVRADCSTFLEELLGELAVMGEARARWSPAELAPFRVKPVPGHDSTEPAIEGFDAPAAKGFFTELRAALPAGACVVADSGRHQVLATRYFPVLQPRGLILPTDFQSMGFGLPAAIGAKLAAPERPVVALIGDGGFAISGADLATAVRERIPLTVIVFNDHALGQIRVQQLSSSGESYATELRTPDLSLFAESVGAQYLRLTSKSMKDLGAAVLEGAVMLAEVAVGDTLSMHIARAKGVLRRVARDTLGTKALQRLRRGMRS